jgi:cytochrome c peroxidase
MTAIHKRNFRVSAIACATAVFLFVSIQPARGQATPPPSLKTLPVPEPPNLSQFVRNRSAAIALGKALFWDMQVGSDAIVACATCHFHAGADSRSKNQVSPGLKRVSPGYGPNPDRNFDKGPNATLVATDFPFRKLADPNNRSSAVLGDTNDVASSQGVFHRIFVSGGSGAIDDSFSSPDPDGFRAGSLNVRRVEPRNTPTVINAVFNFRNFWDGRAQNDFNGVNIHGARDPQAAVYMSQIGQPPQPVKVSLINSSLASQAVGPPVNSFEMSADGRSFPEVGDKFTRRFRLRFRRLSEGRPLANQLVHPQDSVLGSLSRWPLRGLSVISYDQMIRTAFHPKWWFAPLWMIRVESNGTRTVLPIRLPLQANEFMLMEYNFSLFFGLAVQMYERTLVSDDAPFDRFAQGQTTALTAQQQEGLQLFLTNGCIFCHGGPEFSDATVRRVGPNRLRRRSGQLIDTGFNNIGVRPTLEDPSIGATDGTALNRPLSEARLAKMGLFTDSNLDPPLSAEDVLAVDGGFKIPGLRNVELTAPYFHNGGQLTLRGVVDFYNRGGDFVPIAGRDGVIAPLNILALTDAQKEALVAFLRSLTDERVRFRRAPFDHPELFVPNGQTGAQGLPGQAADIMLHIPAVGRSGGAPLPNFLGIP